MPVLDGRRPSSSAVRLGQHTGEAVWALVKFMLSLANRSRFGVCTLPAYPPFRLVQSFMSSTEIISTFGRDCADAQ